MARAARHALRVVGLDGVDGGRRSRPWSRNANSPSPVGRHVLEARALGDHRLAGGQVAGVALAEPAAAQPHVLVLGHRPLRPRGAEELLVAATGRATSASGLESAQPLRQQQLAVGRVVDVERRARSAAAAGAAAGRGTSGTRGACSRSRSRRARPRRGPSASSCRWSCSCGAAGVERHRPQVEVDRLARLQVGEAGRRAAPRSRAPRSSRRRSRSCRGRRAPSCVFSLPFASSSWLVTGSVST